jgi:hypothetical protein
LGEEYKKIKFYKIKMLLNYGYLCTRVRIRWSRRESKKGKFGMTKYLEWQFVLSWTNTETNILEMDQQYSACSTEYMEDGSGSSTCSEWIITHCRKGNVNKNVR